MCFIFVDWSTLYSPYQKTESYIYLCISLKHSIELVLWHMTNRFKHGYKFFLCNCEHTYIRKLHTEGSISHGTSNQSGAHTINCPDHMKVNTYSLILTSCDIPFEVISSLSAYPHLTESLNLVCTT